MICTIRRSLINCCDSDPDKLIGKCSEEEIALARINNDRKAHLIGTHCVDKGPFWSAVCASERKSLLTIRNPGSVGWCRNKAVCSWA